MLIEDKTLWLEALRSGKYSQAFGFLKVNRQGKYHYCCIGVLLDLVADKYHIAETEKVTDPSVKQFDGDNAALTENLKKTVGLKADIVPVLYSMNDFDKLTFSQIADWIEAHVQVNPEATAETTNA
jgi:hypothetical protein